SSLVALKGAHLVCQKQALGPLPTASANHSFPCSTMTTLTRSEVRVLDLFAGTGAIGLEALSRGAHSATAVESHPDAIKVINANKSVTNLPLEIVRADVQKWVTQPVGAKFDLVFLDPPYDFPSGELQAIVDHVIQHCVAEGAIVLVERSSRSKAITAPPEWESSERKFGDTTVQKLVW
ncbi:MAG: rRNA ((966)-N(2))-methyltransferase RsmD, partial [Actinomycetota bacterium]